ncbi:MAG: sigma-70 family RNA polymerase sigma factor [Lachnospiraceae bacterium]|nr:sigma-70 family RNA polymerase sigma factor [Lachnospiraceae bacterium]
MIFVMVVETEEDKSKLEIIVQQYGRLMYKIALDVVKNHHDVQDILQDAFEKIAKNLSHVGDPYDKTTRNYIAVITKNTALDLYRKKKRMWNKEVDIDGLARNQIPRVYIQTVEEQEKAFVVDAINSLPYKYRVVLSLKFTEKRSIKEISKMLNISETNVKQRIFRAKGMLKEELQKRTQ